MTFFSDLIPYLVTAFETAGVLIILWGGAQGLYFFLKHEINRAKLDRIEKVRYILGNKMLIGLEFFLAGDILQTIITPTWEDLGKLGALVVIRTILSFFLDREIKGKKHFSGKAD